MEKTNNLVAFGFGAFAFIIFASIAFMLGKQSYEIDRTAPLQTPAIPNTQVQVLSSVADAIKKTFKNQPPSFIKEKGWHEMVTLSQKWTSDESYVYVMYHAEEGKNPVDVFVISVPKRNIDNVPGLTNNGLKLMGFSETGEDLYAASKTFAVGEKLISALGVIHTVKSIIVSEEMDIVTLEPAILAEEADRNYLYVQRVDALIEKIQISR